MLNAPLSQKINYNFFFRQSSTRKEFIFFGVKNLRYLDHKKYLSKKFKSHSFFFYSSDKNHFPFFFDKKKGFSAFFGSFIENYICSKYSKNFLESLLSLDFDYRNFDFFLKQSIEKLFSPKDSFSGKIKKIKFCFFKKAKFYLFDFTRKTIFRGE